jgi:hypothetical protein
MSLLNILAIAAGTKVLNDEVQKAKAKANPLKIESRVDMGDLEKALMQPGIQGRFRGAQGEQGKSAYQEWLDAGNVGTLQNFLASNFGFSAYDIAVQHGYIGTKSDWIESLVGPKGEIGEKGEKGLKGDKGDAGTAAKIVLDANNLSAAIGGVTFTATLADPLVLLASTPMSGFVSSKIYLAGNSNGWQTGLPNDVNGEIIRNQGFLGFANCTFGLFSSGYSCKFEGVFSAGGQVFKVYGVTVEQDYVKIIIELL